MYPPLVVQTVLLHYGLIACSLYILSCAKLIMNSYTYIKLHQNDVSKHSFCLSTYIFYVIAYKKQTLKFNVFSTSRNYIVVQPWVCKLFTLMIYFYIGYQKRQRAVR